MLSGRSGWAIATGYSNYYSNTIKSDVHAGWLLMPQNFVLKLIKKKI